jgi:outer membrane protein insertion porin family
LKGVDKEFLEQATSFIQRDITPNSRVNLALYNTFNTKHGKYRTEKLKNIGEAPHILDSFLVDVSQTQIKYFLQNKGYLKATVTNEIQIKNKKAYITFTADTGVLFKIKNIEFSIPDTALKSVYLSNRELLTHLHSGSRVDKDSMQYEHDIVAYRIMKEHGYFDYLRQYLTIDVDTNLNSAQGNLKVYIGNPENKTAHQTYTINNSFITILNSTSKIEGIQPDSTVIDTQYYFKDYSKRFKAAALSRYIFLKKGALYNIDNEELTYNRLYDLNVFKTLGKIDYIKTSDSTNRLNPQIEVTPLKRLTDRIEGEYTFNSGRNGFNVSNTYTNRNLFGGAEQLEIKLRYGVLFDSRLSGPVLNRVFSRDLQVGANLTLPKLLIPFNTGQTGRYGLSHTTISSSVQLFNQPQAFRNQIFTNSLTYNWVETIYKQHSFTPVNIEYRKGSLDNVFLQQLRKNGYELYIRSNNRQYVNIGSQYSFTYNFLRLNTYDNFFYFKGTADVGGNTLRLLDKAFGFTRDSLNNNKNHKIFGLPYLQYAKTELDFRWYKSLGGERQVVARINPGIAAPMGNTEALPFEKNFYAGGSTGIRAWQARTLGPGNYNRAVLSSDSLRTNLRNLDQLGELKLESNLEYRFKIANDVFSSKLKGAFFADAGNVWRLKKNADNPDGEFKLNRFFNQIALGVGAGLRFDVDYFVIRLDAGIKVKDPQFKNTDQWVIKKLFNSSEFIDNYEATHYPDKYRIIQYNFGIGMPF